MVNQDGTQTLFGAASSQNCHWFGGYRTCCRSCRQFLFSRRHCRHDGRGGYALSCVGNRNRIYNGLRASMGARTALRLGASLGTMAILTILLAGIGWFQHNHLPIPDKGAAQMALSRVDIEGIPKTSAYQFNAVIHNDGTASAIGENTAVAGKLSDHLLSKDDIDVIMAKLEKFNLAIEQHKGHFIFKPQNPTVG